MRTQVKMIKEELDIQRRQRKESNLDQESDDEEEEEEEGYGDDGVGDDLHGAQVTPGTPSAGGPESNGMDSIGSRSAGSLQLRPFGSPNTKCMVSTMVMKKLEIERRIEEEDERDNERYRNARNAVGHCVYVSV